MYLASVCWSLQCLIFALTQVGRHGLLFRFTCSVVLWGGRDTADKYHLRVWRALSVFWPHWVCPHCGMCVFPVYTAQALGYSIGSGPWVACSSSFRELHKGTDSFGPAFCAFPGLSNSGSQVLDKCTLPGCSAPYPLSGPSLSFWERQLGAPCVCSGELVSNCDPPGGCQPSRISGSLWLETGSLFAVW